MTVDATQVNPQPAVPPGLRTSNPQDFLIEFKNLPGWVRPEVVYWYPQWRMIRDACEGERRIKELGTYYLPMLEGMEARDYDAFKSRATYYNFTQRTVSSMTGSVFRRQPVITGLPENMLNRLKYIGKDRQDFETFASGATEEIVKLSRYGVLLDLPMTVTTEPQPYFCGYTAENILDWDEGEDAEGRYQCTLVVLRETNTGYTPATEGSARKLFVRYRRLVLEDGPTVGSKVYVQYVHSRDNADADMTSADKIERIVPLMNGQPLSYIPFQLIGAHQSTFCVEKPPVDDIATLNLSHYRSYAYLEHGRFFAGFPIYYAEEPQGGGQTDYRIGASNVWIIPTGGKAGILELNGQGLKFLENALAQKEMQAVSIGSKLLGGQNMPAKGADQLILEERNEQSVLLKITRQLDKGFTILLKWWASWAGMSDDEVAGIEVTFNKDFLFEGVGAREFRAIHMMYKEGVLPIEVVYYYMRKGYVIPDWMSLEEFTDQLQKTSSFPGQPDAVARLEEGYQSRQQQLSHEEKEASIDIQQQEIELQKEVQDAANKLQQAQIKLMRLQQQKNAGPAASAPGQTQNGDGKAGFTKGGVQPIAKVPNASVPLPGVKPTGKI